LFCQILEEHKLQGEEDQALEKRVEGKKAAAKKRAARKSLYFSPLFFMMYTDKITATRSKKVAQPVPRDEDMYTSD
jgi:condensin complex subunit 1